ncbi:recombinase family protein [Dehalogenimonas alkenigignens]|uniref:recombinase family protein n=1 Tax=Dehalogenimonas alkenigignens TaxID=1217799 RepID=UPI000D57D174|nr:recombinase family protein [Dehalogenimonas alkenigignens]PVV83526.1 resolvase [Dehalogenimonas alkenigignens]
MKVALYARVSTRDKDQNPEVQLNLLREFCAAEGHEITGEYIDQASASDFVRRTDWSRLMKDVATRKGFKAVVVWKLDRAFRDVTMAVNSVEILRGAGVDFFVSTCPILNVQGPAGDLMFNIYAAFAQFERDTIIERVNAGLALAKKEGRVFGRPRKAIGLAKVCAAYRDGGNNLTRAAESLTRDTGVRVSHGFVAKRLDRAAEAEGLTRAELVARELAKPSPKNEGDLIGAGVGGAEISKRGVLSQ